MSTMELRKTNLETYRTYSIEENLQSSTSVLENPSSNCFHCLINKGRLMKFRKGERVVSKFGEVEGLYFVYSGLVKLTKQDVNGNELIIDIKMEGEIFSVSGLFDTRENTYLRAATMIQAGELIYIKSDDLEEEIMICPYLSMGIIKYLDEEIEKSTDRLVSMAHSNIFSKTVRTIGLLVNKFGIRHRNSVYLDLPITIQELSDIIGHTRESTSRSLSKLKNIGLVKMRKKQLIITDWDRFHSLV